MQTALKLAAAEAAFLDPETQKFGGLNIMNEQKKTISATGKKPKIILKETFLGTKSLVEIFKNISFEAIKPDSKIN